MDELPLTWEQVEKALKELTPEQKKMSACVLMDNGRIINIYDTITAEDSPKALLIFTPIDGPHQPFLTTFNKYAYAGKDGICENCGIPCDYHSDLCLCEKCLPAVCLSLSECFCKEVKK